MLLEADCSVIFIDSSTLLLSSFVLNDILGIDTLIFRVISHQVNCIVFISTLDKELLKCCFLLYFNIASIFIFYFSFSDRLLICHYSGWDLGRLSLIEIWGFNRISNLQILYHSLFLSGFRGFLRHVHFRKLSNSIKVA